MLLDQSQIEQVEKAIELIKNFVDSAEREGVLELD